MDIGIKSDVLNHLLSIHCPPPNFSSTAGGLGVDLDAPSMPAPMQDGRLPSGRVHVAIRHNRA
eukprot:11518831-Karenia_brevis.AAC.1